MLSPLARLAPRGLLLPLLTLLACASSTATPATTPVNTTTAAPDGPPVPAATDAPPACPADPAAARGQSCVSEGQWCADGKNPQLGLLCQQGSWQTSDVVRPPCCKK